MRRRVFVVLVLAACICSAASAGVAYAFATSVVPGLGGADPRASIAAMQGIIDEAASNVLLLLLLFGCAALAIAVGVVAAVQLRSRGSVYLLLGSVCTLAAGIVTVAFNVPLNRHLTSLVVGELSVIDATREWHDYADPWAVWNYIRCGFGLVGAVLLAVGLWKRAVSS